MAKYKKASEIKVGVVGYGGAFNMGKWHLNEMLKAGMTPVAVAEIDPKRLEVAKSDFPGIGTFASLGQMLKKSDVDLVTLITPHNTHAKLARQALNAGKHVVCEKPLAITTLQCDAMIAAARKNNAVISTYHNRHWDGWILNAMKHLKAGLIGEVVRVEAHMGGYNKPGDWWRSSKNTSGGILYDWGVHLLEYSLQILGPTAKMREVTAFSKCGFWAQRTPWKKDCNEDESCAVVRFTNGAWLSLLVSSIDNNPRRGLVEVTGTKASYILDWNANELIRKEDGLTISTKYPNSPSEGWRFYQNVADHLVKGAKLVITGEWARRPIHILDLADQSARKGCAIKTKYE
jgi:predicted dehydrogenase